MTIPGQPSISLHVERLVIDESLLAAGGERGLRQALAEALECMLPGAIAGATPEARSSRPSGPEGPRGMAPVTAGGPPLLATGIAERVAWHVGSMVASVASGGGVR